MFKEYNPLWQQDHDDELDRFLSNNPYVSEFETKIKYYENLATKINSQPEYITVGPLAIFTGIDLFFFFVIKILNYLIGFFFFIN